MKITLMEAAQLTAAMGEAWDECCEKLDIPSDDCPSVYQTIFQIAWWHGAHAVSDLIRN